MAEELEKNVEDEVVDINSLPDDEFMEQIIREAGGDEYQQEDEGPIEETDQDQDDENDGSDEAESDSDTDAVDDETEEDDQDTDDSDFEENSQDDNEYDDEAETNENPGGEDDGNTDDNEDETETEEPKETDGDEDGETSDGDEVEESDYKQKYEELMKEKEKLQSFYDIATSDYTANGKKMKGTVDPKKLILAQQMSAGFSEKMYGFKKYRPFLKPIEERGLFDDPDKFNLIMAIADGDTEAIKTHVKNLKIDPITDLNIDEEIKYQANDLRTSDLELNLDDMVQRVSGSDNKHVLDTIIGKDGWDNDSVVKLLSDKKYSDVIVNHINDGIYDEVAERISELKMRDVNGSYMMRNDIEQYEIAANQLASEYDQKIQAEANNIRQKIEPEKNSVQDELMKLEKEKQLIEQEKAKLEQAKKEAIYKAEVEAKLKLDNEKRKNAANVSKKRGSAPSKAKKTFDPLKMSDDDFSKMLDGLIYQR